MKRQTVAYGFKTTIDAPYREAVHLTRDALAAEGFGVLCEIDVAATLRAKLGVDVGPYVILGVCNPSLANAALAIDRDVGLLLPCNVVVYATGEPNRCVVAALDPDRALALTGSDALRPVAADAKARLERALATVERLHAGPSNAAVKEAPVEVAEEIC